MLGQFIKQESFMGWNLICRKLGSFIGKGIQQIATTIWKKKHTVDSLPMRIEAPIQKRKAFFGV